MIKNNKKIQVPELALQCHSGFQLSNFDISTYKLIWRCPLGPPNLHVNTYTALPGHAKCVLTCEFGGLDETIV
jgi:hypothetical protein